MMPQEGFTAAALSTRIEAFLSLPESLARAASYARKAGRVHAARDLANLVLRLTGGASNGVHRAAKVEEAA